MSRILVATFAFLLFTLSAAALHAQVPYTSSPLPGMQQQPLYQPSPAVVPMWQPPQLQPTQPTQEVPRQRSGGSGDIYGDIYGTRQYNPPPVRLWQPPPSPSQQYHQEFMRQMEQERERYSYEEQRAEQARQLERTIRCNRFGSREVYGDCHNW